MLTTAEARARILAAMPSLAAESVSLARSIGRVLAEPAFAERDQPPFDRVMMDGIAVSHAEYDALERSFPIQATQMAGDPPLELEPGHCIEIMTGAALPLGADARAGELHGRAPPVHPPSRLGLRQRRRVTQAGSQDTFGRCRDPRVRRTRGGPGRSPARRQRHLYGQ